MLGVQSVQSRCAGACKNGVGDAMWKGGFMGLGGKNGAEISTPFYCSENNSSGWWVRR